MLQATGFDDSQESWHFIREMEKIAAKKNQYFFSSSGSPNKILSFTVAFLIQGVCGT